MMKAYQGVRLNPKTRTVSDVSVRVIISPTGVGSELDPGPSQKLFNHSPDGFNWSYAGSGPAQLALAILLDHTGDKEIAVAMHQRFKFAFVARWGDYWRITSEEIDAWLAHESTT